VQIKGEPGLASIELCPAKNVQAGHGSLWDITYVGCKEPYVQASLWNRSTEVAIIRYTASITVDAVLCNLNSFFEKPCIFRLLSLISKKSRKNPIQLNLVCQEIFYGRYITILGRFEQFSIIFLDLVAQIGYFYALR
jgi:hypothetical protein